MSAIPPNFIGSAIQSADAQRKASESKEVDESRTASDRARQVARNEEMGSTVETTDADTQVHTEGGGLGSQGRDFAEESEEPETQDAEQDSSGITTDADGQLHLDLEA